MDKESYISVFVKQMRVNVRIGLHDFERAAPQPLDVSVELFTDVAYLGAVDPENIIDYAKIHAAIKGWEARDHVELIEPYLQELLALGFAFKNVNAVRARISKAKIFAETNAAGLEAFVLRKDFY